MDYLEYRWNKSMYHTWLTQATFLQKHQTLWNVFWGIKSIYHGGKKKIHKSKPNIYITFLKPLKPKMGRKIAMPKGVHLKSTQSVALTDLFMRIHACLVNFTAIIILKLLFPRFCAFCSLHCYFSVYEMQRVTYYAPSLTNPGLA